MMVNLIVKSSIFYIVIYGFVTKKMMGKINNIIDISTYIQRNLFVVILVPGKPVG
jgi:hypothetical protein